MSRATFHAASALPTPWMRWPGRIAVARPPCSTPRCPRPPSRWRRCRCGAAIAICGECPGTIETVAAAHAERCAA